MDITLHLQFLSWHFALLVTLVGLIAFLLVAHREAKSGGDYYIPLMSMAVFLVWITASLTCWGYVIVANFTK